jgi:4-hydroxy-tetrahydrodipicolinate reductase
VIEVVVSGAAGRLGRRILAAFAGADDARVTRALLRPGSAASDLGVPVDFDAERAIASGVVLVETAPHEAAAQHVARASEARVPCVVATTGFTAAERRTIESASELVPVVLAPNLSPGVAVLMDLVERAARALPGYDLEIVELHHGKKKDAPSGTAWALASAAAGAREQDLQRDAILARAGETGARGQREIGIQALRGGDVVGEHTVMLIGRNERIELVHRASSRDVFAQGTLQAVRFVAAAGRTPGFHDMRDVLGLR